MTPGQFKAYAESWVGADTTFDYDPRGIGRPRPDVVRFNYYGHSNVKVSTAAAGLGESRQPTTLAAPSPAAVSFTPRADESYIATGDELKSACSLDGVRDNVVVWDVRSDAEWDGTAENYRNKRIGHVPGAVHLEWFHLMDRNTHEFKSAAEIRQILAEHGITPDKTAYSY